MTELSGIAADIATGLNQLLDMVGAPEPGDPDNERAFLVQSREGRMLPLPVSMLARFAEASVQEREREARIRQIQERQHFSSGGGGGGEAARR